MIWAAFILGLGGSLHCAAMCGPLVFSMQKSWDIRGVNLPLILYHTGRILAYVALGFAISLIKVPVYVFNLQQYISLVSGIILLLFVFKNRIPGVRNVMSAISTRLSNTMSSYYGKKNSLPFLGFLNGLLPCGLSYSAAAVSVSQTTLSESLVFMTVFGLGTLPMFLIGSYVGQKVKLQGFRKLNQLVKYSMVLVGLLLVLRGSGLAIPYISPAIDIESSEVECCHPQP